MVIVDFAHAKTKKELRERYDRLRGNLPSLDAYPATMGCVSELMSDMRTYAERGDAAIFDALHCRVVQIVGQLIDWDQGSRKRPF